MCGWEGVRDVESCWRPYSGGVLLDHPENKPRGGGAPDRLTHAAKSLSMSLFLNDDIFAWLSSNTRIQYLSLTTSYAVVNLRLSTIGKCV